MALTVMHVSHGAAGGAGRAGRRAHLATRAAGLLSAFAFIEGEATAPDDILLRPRAPDDAGEAALARALHERVQWGVVQSARRAATNTLFSIAHPALALEHQALFAAADVIHLHWTSWAVAPATLRHWLAAGRRVVWTLHDLWPMTGGCHYPAGCEQYRTACLQCPQLSDAWSLVPNAFAEKRAAWSAPGAVVVAPSAWIAACARASAILRGCRVEVIPNAVGTEAFAPRPDRDALRTAWGLAPEDLLLVAGAHDNREARKGGALLMEALRALAEDGRLAALLPAGAQVAVAGFGKFALPPVPGLRRLDFGEVAEDDVLADILAAADLACIPSLEDNYPNVALEALACGTPCLATPVGGLPELVREGSSGVLAEAATAPALAEALLRFVARHHRDAGLRASARAQVEAENAIPVIGARLAALYRDLAREGRVAEAGTSGRAPAGATGDRAPAGVTGDRAPAGVTGDRAPAGVTGDRAPAGVTDARAPAGATDARAPAGATDARAPAGATDARAPAGATHARALRAFAQAPVPVAALPGAPFLRFPMNLLLREAAGPAAAAVAVPPPAPPPAGALRVMALRALHAHHGARSGPWQFLRHLPDGIAAASRATPLGAGLAGAEAAAWRDWGRLLGTVPFGQQGNAWLAETEILAECADTPFDLVHAIDGELALWLLPRIPAALFHGGRRPAMAATFHQPPALLAGMVNPALLRALDAVVVLCEAQRAALAGMLPPGRLHVIPHGIDAGFFTPGPRAAGEGFRLLAVGHWLRDFGTLFATLARLRDDGLDARLRIVSPNPPRGVPPGVEVEAGLSDEALREAYRDADALLLPLTDATANNAILEAMACGRPVVSTDVGGVAEMTGRAALLGPPGDARALADAVLSLATDPAGAAALGRAARARAEALDWRHIAARHAALYAAIAGARA